MEVNENDTFLHNWHQLRLSENSIFSLKAGTCTGVLDVHFRNFPQFSRNFPATFPHFSAIFPFAGPGNLLFCSWCYKPLPKH